MSVFHPAAWLSWWAGVTVVALVLDDPVAVAAAFVVAVATGIALAPSGPEGRTWVLMLRLGIAFAAVRLVLFGLTGHTGDTTVVVLPVLELPAAAGGLTIGGPVTAEVLAQSAFEGLRIATVLVAIGVVLSTVPVHRVLRLLPPTLHEVGLVIGIALAFIPALVRSASDIRDAQRARGHRFRGPRALRALVIPVLASALERSLTLAASMEVRGYGRGHRDASRHARVLITAGLVLVAGGGGLALFGRSVGLPPLALGAFLLWRGLGDTASPRTRLASDPIDIWDAGMITAGAAVIALTVAGAAAGLGAWSAYPRATMPSLDARTAVVALISLAPMLIDGVRAARLRRLGEPVPVAGVAR